MTFDAQTFLPHPALRSIVHHYFGAGSSRRRTTRRLLPDGCITLIFNLGDAGGTLSSIVEPDACVVGPMTVAVTEERFPASPLLGVTLTPCGASLVGRASDLVDRVVDLRSLWGARAQDLLDRLRGESTVELQLHQLDEFLIERSRELTAPDPIVAAALELVRSNGGRLPIRELAVTLGTSERRLERVLRAETGLSPKRISRIARLQIALAHIAKTPRSASWVDMACDLGFADQSHMIREFRVLTGATPAELACANHVATWFTADRGPLPDLPRTRLCSATPQELR